MKKSLSVLLLVLATASFLRALPAGVSSLAFTTSKPEFVAGDLITITEVYATSPNLVPGTTVVVRGTYTLQSQPAAVLSVSLTTSSSVGPQPVQAASRTSITAGNGSFELEHTIQFDGTLHVTFSPVTSGSSFASIYFASGSGTTGGGSTGGTTTPPPTTNPGTSVPAVSTVGLVSVPFTTSKAQFASGDSITITEVLATSANFGPGDRVMARGVYTLQSQPDAAVAISLTANAPGFRETIAPNSIKSVSGGSGTFEVAYEIKQPGAMHVTFYPAAGGSSFGGIYFAPAGSNSATTSTTAALVTPATNTGLLGNLSIRTVVTPGSGALIAGLNVTDRERYVLIRAVGPTLAQFGVSGVLAKPTLTVYNASGQVVASAASWTANFSALQRSGIAMLSSSVGAFALNAGSDDAVLHLRLEPGSYTVQVASADGQSGAVLMEVYASSTFALPQ